MALKTMSIAKLQDLKRRSRPPSHRGQASDATSSNLNYRGLPESTAAESPPSSLHAAERERLPRNFANSENPSETWVGRGLKPRWLAAAIKSGKKPSMIFSSRMSRRRSSRNLRERCANKIIWMGPTKRVHKQLCPLQPSRRRSEGIATFGPGACTSAFLFAAPVVARYRGRPVDRIAEPGDRSCP
jgi:hypothetical protein